MKLLTNRQKVLIQHSAVLEEYPIIKQLFDKYDELTVELMEQLSDEERQFVRNTLPNVIKQAEAEWKTDGRISEDMGKDKRNFVRCSLCRQPNRYVFYICNQFNNTKLNIGRECIKHFSILEREGLSIRTLIKNARRYRRIHELDQYYPGIQQLLESWNDQLDRYELTIPLLFENRYTELGQAVRRIFDAYVDGKITIENTAELKTLLKERDEIIRNIQYWVQENKDSPFAPRKQIERWLKNKGDTVGVQWLKEDGKITHRTAHRIMEPEFMRWLSQQLRETYKDLGINLWEPIEEHQGYLVRFQEFSEVLLVCRHVDLVRKYCGGYFGGEPRLAAPGELLAICRPPHNIQAYNSIFERIARILDVPVYNLDVYRDFAVLRDGSKFVVLSVKVFVQRFFKIAYGDKTLQEEARKTIYAPTNPRYEKEEILEIGYGRTKTGRIIRR